MTLQTRIEDGLVALFNESGAIAWQSASRLTAALANSRNQGLVLTRTRIEGVEIAEASVAGRRGPHRASEGVVTGVMEFHISGPIDRAIDPNTGSVADSVLRAVAQSQRGLTLHDGSSATDRRLSYDIERSQVTRGVEEYRADGVSVATDLLEVTVTYGASPTD